METLMVNPATGQTVIMSTVSRWGKVDRSINLRYPTPGLKAEKLGSFIRLTYESAEEITEADARDAQCRGGWSDTGYGFYGLSIIKNPTTGRWTATWDCDSSCG